jgi:hypothetical protein
MASALTESRQPACRTRMASRYTGRVRPMNLSMITMITSPMWGEVVTVHVS